jgi:hypothetical protein
MDPTISLSGDRLALSLVRRAKRVGLPSTMDLPVDPVIIFESLKLHRDVNGYKMAYQIGRDGSVGHNGSLS